MRRNSVSSITYGALFTALVGVLVYINRILANSLEVYFFWIVPVVIVVYRCKFDLRDTIMTSFAMVLLTSILSGIISTTTFYMIASIIAGIVYAQGFINGRSATFLICSVILISLVVMIVSTFLFASFFGYDVAGELQLYQQMLNQSFAQMGISSEMFSQMFDQNFILTIFIIASVLSSVLEGILVHFLNYLALKKLKMDLPPMKPISQIYCPLWLKIIIGVIMVGFVIGRFINPSFVNEYLIAPFTVVELICFCFGYIFIVTFISLAYPKKSGLLGLVVGVLCLFLASIVFIIGVFDVFTDIRKRTIERYLKNVQQQNR
ncbi:MAG: DUF2232 domain-containing protein [Erysipelotrichaceae bacterium]|nr:DUF2232 domain-containing protein [Erysipelotrichaceae bacterium]MDY5727651.1 DUF2232 domain-containing protein [Erysipelotrichaceae bacterium]